MWQFSNKATKKTEFFAESFDLDLNRISELKKIIELEGKVETKNMLFNKQAGKSVVCYFSRVDLPNAEVHFEFVKLATDLTIENTGVIKIPFTKYEKTKQIDMSDFYEIADNGLVRGYFTLAQFNSGVSVAQRDLIAVELDVKDNSYFLLDYKSKEEEKEWLDISMIDAQGKSYIVGLYKDTKASSSSTSHVPSGLFVAERYTDQKGIRGIKYVEMDLKSMADHLPKNSSEELEKGKLRFEINTIERFENDFIVFYSEVRSCPGQESLVPTRCKRLMYACARLTLQGDIVWNKPIYEKAKDAAERRVNFRLSLDENKLFITYHGSHAAKSELRDHLNLVFIDLGTGQMKVNEAPVVQVGMPPIEGKAILEDTASYNNERIYVYKELNQEVPSIILSVLRPVD